MRIKALVIDLLVLLAIAYFFSVLIDDIGGKTYAGVVLMSLLFLYEPLLISLFGKTLGHLLVGIKVKDYSNTYKNINFFNALIRLFFKTFLGWWSFISMFSNTSRRALHDIASNSIVLVNKD